MMLYSKYGDKLNGHFDIHYVARLFISAETSLYKTTSMLVGVY